MPDNEAPVEVIQADRDAAGELWMQAVGIDDASQVDPNDGLAAAQLEEIAIAFARHRFAFSAAPADGDLRDMPADDEIRLLREALTIYGDRVRMARSSRPDLQQVIDYAFEHAPNRPAWGGDSETRHSHLGDREAIARMLADIEVRASNAEALWKEAGSPGPDKCDRVSGSTQYGAMMAFRRLAKDIAILSLPSPVGEEK